MTLQQVCISDLLDLSFVFFLVCYRSLVFLIQTSDAMVCWTLLTDSSWENGTLN
uniref:Uncharacterized protein n=1 Tax=Arundo donax TaxID=35708 RepID=A0A0A9AGJ2_ARUDO